MKHNNKPKGERGKRSDSVPNDIPYCKMNEDQRAELNDVITHKCLKIGHRLSRMTNGTITREEAFDELYQNAFLVLHELENEKVVKGKTYNVVAYISTTLNNHYRDLLDKFYDRKNVGTQMLHRFSASFHHSESSEDVLIRNEEQKLAADAASSFIKTICDAAYELGIPVDRDDWIVTAVKVINKGIHRGKLKGDLRERVVFLQESLESRGYKTKRSGETETTYIRAKGIVQRVRNIIKNSPQITNKEIYMKLDKDSIHYNPKAVKVIASVARKKFGITLDKKRIVENSTASEVREIWKSGVVDYKEVHSKLVERGRIFKPSTVRTYVRLLNKKGVIHLG